jgi:ArsR family transcriptional regulator
MVTVAAALAATHHSADVELATLAKALGHPARVAILRLLGGREGCFCGEIVEHLPLAQATVSQHLKLLKDAGLVRGEIDGPRVCYCANRPMLEHARELMAVLMGDALDPRRSPTISTGR